MNNPAPTVTLLVCAATAMELAAFDSSWGAGAEPSLISFGPECASGFVTGVGVPCALAAVLARAAEVRPRLILNIGIAGAYPGSRLEIGEIVAADSEVYGDIGMDLPGPPFFRPLSATPWGAWYSHPLPLARCAPWASARGGRGCTVGTCTGTDEVGIRRAQLFDAHFETMEGAAVAQAGAILGIPVCEVRAISNRAGRRDMRPENIGAALRALTDYLQNSREKADA